MPQSGGHHLLSVFFRLNIEVPASCQVDVCINFGNHLQNSMWTGNSILVGDGREGRSYPFSTPDCMCHEFAHCLTDSWSGLLMNGQAGGINDAFSDAFSQVRERFHTPGCERSHSYWVGGYFPSLFRTCLRAVS